MKKQFYGVDVNEILKIKGKKGYGVSIAIAQNDQVETFCSGSGRFGESFPVNPDMIFQAGSVSKPMFALTLLRYVDKGIIDLDADISGVVSDFVKNPLTFERLLSHTAGYSVHGFFGYRADAQQISLEDVIAGRGNSPKVCRIKPYGKQYKYSGGGTTLAELAFTRITGTTLREAFHKEVVEPLGLTRTGYFQPLDEQLVSNAAFGGRLRERKNEDHAHGYHYYPEHAAAGLWSTPAELAKIGIALAKNLREDGLLKKETVSRMVTPIMDDYGLCVRTFDGTFGHDGANEGFLTYWRFGQAKDFCVVGMINNLYGCSYQGLHEVCDALVDAIK